MHITVIIKYTGTKFFFINQNKLEYKNIYQNLKSLYLVNKTDETLPKTGVV